MINKKQFTLTLGLAALVFGSFTNCTETTSKANGKSTLTDSTTVAPEAEEETVSSTIDTAKYNQKLRELANGDTSGRWPVSNQPYPLPGAILPNKRVVVYYGNMHSKKMGALGEYAPKEMWSRLNAEIKRWEKVDPKTPVQAGIHYIAVVASGTPGKDGMYVNRMPDKQIDSALTIAKMHNAILFLDLQVGLSTIQKELPRIEKYLKMPNVHLGIDPEFSMKGGQRPGAKIGTYDASDVNYCTDYLAKLIKQNNLPPKIFVLHRFTEKMVTNYKNIKLRPEVQFVMHMDGWGEPELKKGTYRYFIERQPVQFAGFKLFYKNDIKKAPNRMMTPEDLMKLKPIPSYIQYQ
ncbi:MAG: hypothetical protein ABI390_06415 [Daejeonella sp.]